MVIHIYKRALSYKDDLNPSLGFAIKYFQYFGVWRVGRSRFKTIVSHFTMTICFFYMMDLIINFVFTFNFDIGLWFVQYSAVHLGMIKILAFVRKLKQWESLSADMADIDIRSAKARNAKMYFPIIMKFRGYCRKCVVAYVTIAILINISFIMIFMVNNMMLPLIANNTNIFKVFSAYLPFDENMPLGRNLSTLIQVLYFETSVVYVVGWDAFVVSSLMFLIGHFKALRERCALAVEGREYISLCNIGECHQQYIDLKSCYEKLNTLMSPLIFLHLLLVTVNLGVCIIFVTHSKDNITDLMSVFLLISALMIQMFMCYWLADMVVIQHDAVMYGVFESNWTASGPRVRKSVLLLAEGMNRTITFSAGPFNDMSRVALTSILKTAYSFYTLLSSGRSI